VADALADESEQVEGGRVIRALFKESVEREECWKQVIWRCAVAVPGAEVVEFAFGEFDVGFGLGKKNKGR
jgi:hypothetical protein